MYKNGSTVWIQVSPNEQLFKTFIHKPKVDCNGFTDTDYLEIYARQDVSSGSLNLIKY